MHELIQAEKTSALDAIRELLDTYFPEAEDSADDDGKFSLGFRATFDRSHSPSKLKVTCRISNVTSGEIEITVDDPAQPRLDGLE